MPAIRRKAFAVNKVFAITPALVLLATSKSGNFLIRYPSGEGHGDRGEEVTRGAARRPVAVGHDRVPRDWLQATRERPARQLGPVGVQIEAERAVRLCGLQPVARNAVMAHGDGTPRGTPSYLFAPISVALT